MEQAELTVFTLDKNYMRSLIFKESRLLKCVSAKEVA